MASDLRPLTLGELLDRTFFLYRKNFVLFFGIMALPHLLLLAFQLAGVGLQSTRILIGPIMNLPWTLAMYVVLLGVTAVSQGATVIAVSHVHLGQSVTITESFAGIKGRILYIALVMFGYWFFIGIGLILLIVPGIIALLMWALTVPVTVIEDTGFFDSLNRSAALTKGHRGRVFVIGLLFLILVWVVYGIWEVPVFATLGIMSRGHRLTSIPLWTQLAIPVGSFLSQCLAGPLMTIGFSLLYYDERVRKEAFDLQHMMTSLDTTQPAPASVAGI
jgi:hypothetical protein